MRLSQPRVPPLTDEEAAEAARDLQEVPPELRGLNFISTLASHPKLAASRRVLGRYILLESTLPAREREQETAALQTYGTAATSKDDPTAVG